jgi:hypothetical protein
MGTNSSNLFRSASNLIPLPSTVLDANVDTAYPILNGDLQTSMLSKLKQKGIADFHPFRIVTLQSLIDSGYVIPNSKKVGKIQYFRLNFSDDMEYLPVGDIVVRKDDTNIDCGNIDRFVEESNGGNLINNVLATNCGEKPFLDMKGSVASQSSTHFDGDVIAQNAVDYTKSAKLSYSHTSNETATNPWWKCTLPSESQISNIVILARETQSPALPAGLDSTKITLTDSSGNVTFTSSLGKAVRNKYVFTFTSPILVKNIKIEKTIPGWLVIGKVICNANYKHIGWYKDKPDPDRAISGNVNVTPQASWITALNSLSSNSSFNIAASQTPDPTYGPLGMPLPLTYYSANSSTCGTTAYGDYKKYSNDDNRFENCMFDVPVLLVKNDPLYSAIIPDSSWTPHAASYGRGGEYGYSWVTCEVRTDISGYKVLGNTIMVGDEYVYKNPTTPRTRNGGDHFANYVVNRTFAAINPDFLVNLTNVTENSLYKFSPTNSNDNIIDWYDIDGMHRWLYSSAFGTFAVKNQDMSQVWSYYDVRPQVLKTLCCTNTSNSIPLFSSDPILNQDLTSYCTDYSPDSATCNNFINTTGCNTLEKLNKTYQTDAGVTITPCKTYLLNKPATFDSLAKNMATFDTKRDPFFSCINPDTSRIDPENTFSDLLRSAYLSNPQCIDPVCKMQGYKTLNNTTACNLQLQQCISTINTNVGTSTDSPISISQTPECQQYSSQTSTQVNSPVNCVPGDWGPWGQCSKTCGGGIQTRTRSIMVPASNGGSECVLLDTQECNTQGCLATDTATDCILGQWGEYGNCVNGSKTRSRSVIVPSSGTGSCDKLTDTISCTSPPPSGSVVNCVLGSWTDGTCVNGKQTRIRKVLVQPSGGGTSCDNLSETISCSSAIDEASNWFSGLQTNYKIGIAVGIFVFFLLIIMILAFAGRKTQVGEE